MGKLLKALGFSGHARIYIVDSTNIVEQARQNQSLWPTASVALGRLLTITSMMGSMLKENQNLTVRFNGDGPLGHMLTTSDEKGNVRGFVQNPNTHLYNDRLKKLEIALAVGKGEIVVSKDLNLKTPYISQCEIISGEVSEDMTYYFAQSEQTPTSISSGVLVNTDNSIISSGGFMVQLLPGCPDHITDLIKKRLHEMPPVSRLIEEKKNPLEILKEICLNDYQIVEEHEVFYQCDCSKERYIQSLSTLPKEELQEMIDENKEIEIVCSFCNKKLQFTPDDLNKSLLLKK